MDPVTDSGGRVTRSLRKRISSVDGENSSRPGTPIPLKLTSITEITSSPSKTTRIMTRRNSTSGVATPVKTPAKRSGATPSLVAESTETVTPVRRNTRRRSVSTNEDEETSLNSKVSVFEAVAEEIAPTTTRLTRLQSKSPDQINSISPTEKNKENNPKSPESIKSGQKSIKTQSHKRRRPGPKSKSRYSEESENLSDVEVIAVEIEEKKSNFELTTIDLLDCDDDTQVLDINNMCADDKSQKKTEETEKTINSPQNSTFKDNLKNASFQIKSVINVDDKMIMLEISNEEQKSDNSKLLNEECTKEKNESIIFNDSMQSSSDACKLNLNIQKTKATSQIDKNITIIDLLDGDDDLSYTKTPNKNTTNNISSDSESRSEKTNENILDVNDAEIVPINPIIKIELANESKSEEILPTMESIILINESFLNQSNTEKTAIAPIIKESPVKNLQEKENLSENKFDATNEIMGTKTLSKLSPEKTALSDKKIDANESEIKKSHKKNLKEKDNLPENKIYDQNEIMTNKSLLNTKSSPEENAKINTNESKTIEASVSNLQKSSNFSDDENHIMPFNPSDKQKIENDSIIDTKSCLATTPDRKSTATIIEVIHINSNLLTPNRGTLSSKKVEFIPSPSSDNTIKSVYPKTPAVTKTKSFIEIDSSRDEIKNTVLDSNNTIIGEIRKCSQDDDIEMDIDEHDEVVSSGKQTVIHCEENTPPRVLKNAHQLKNSQSSSPVMIEVSENELPNDKASEESCGSDICNDQKPNDQVAENIDKVSSTIEIENQLKWINPSVKGYTNEGCKLDAVVKQAVTPKKSLVNNNNDINDEGDISFKSTKKNANILSSEPNAEEEQIAEEEEGEELAPGEEPYKRKHIFLDDEAMEVNGYKSGDSMDSEERREMLENEIPIDGESIGSITTDDENNEDDVEGEYSELDSFIASDTEGEDNVHLKCSDSDDEDDTIDNKDRKKKNNYKRILHPTEQSSSSSDELEAEVDVKTKSSKENSLTKMASPLQKSDNNEFDLSKLSDTALRLQCNVDSESEELEKNNANISRKQILSKLSQSDRFNKSVRDLNPEVETSPIDHTEREQTEVAANSGDDNNATKMSMSEENEEKSESENVNGEEDIHEEDDEKSCAGEESNVSSSGENVESQLGEISVTTESDGNKENNKNQSISNRKPGGVGLSVSFGNIKKPNKHSKKRREWQRSFTIGVSVNGCDLGAAVTENKSIIENNSSSMLSNAADDDQGDELSSDEVHDLEKIRHMPLPLGNPLVRTRRQSLALPTNPDKEICCGGTSKKQKRSLGILSTNEFNPSQSFIDSMQLRKNEFVCQSAKRKRLSKSFCGASESLENSVIDIDVAHLHKRSKLAMDSSVTENYLTSMENINTCKLSSKKAISSTPCEKKEGENDSNNYLQRILSRCDEILEAANSAKLENKVNNKKNKVKLPKGNRKKTLQRLSQDEHQVSDDDEPKTFAKKKKHNDNVRAAALTQALKAADNVIIGKKKQKHLRMGDLGEDNEDDSKRISSDVLEAIAENVVKKNKQKDIISNDQQKLQNHVTIMTTAGNFVEMPSTPEKKRKKKRPEIIQLPTGKIVVEPVTPKQRTVLACDGTKFHESPITPFAVGFEVSHIPTDNHIGKQASILKNLKRKRNFDEQARHTLPKPRWTKSGVFIEEEISTMHRIARSDFTQPTGSRKLKNLSTANKEQNAYNNFKQQALMRDDIKRCTTRDILQLKERRQMQNQF